MSQLLLTSRSKGERETEEKRKFDLEKEMGGKVEKRNGMVMMRGFEGKEAEQVKDRPRCESTLWPKVASVLLEPVTKAASVSQQTLHCSAKRTSRGGERSEEKDLSFNLGSAVGESGVCLDKPGSLWAAEMI
ncbi:hypothetical protein Q5P01_011447 [Channa striata]|uniref:Uncharacterized protein n=1 Tax=Channa striata TaxID=64152 RepID=A0AA88MXD1_CHASR|nr:hypothetical protein Q5P01_011447 [Channa striata]